MPTVGRGGPKTKYPGKDPHRVSTIRLTPNGWRLLPLVLARKGLRLGDWVEEQIVKTAARLRIK